MVDDQAALTADICAASGCERGRRAGGLCLMHYGRRRREKARQLARESPEQIPHGTLSGYDIFGCHCDACSGRKRNRSATYRERNLTRERARQRAVVALRPNWFVSQLQNQSASQSVTLETAVNHRKLWTNAEFVALGDESISNEELAAQLGRSLYAIRKKRALMRRAK